MANKENVRLIRLEYGQEGQILEMIRSDEGLRSTFSGNRNTVSRLAYTDYSALIKVGRKNVGFIMLVANDKTGKHEIDMGILSQYRGKGYGSQALAYLKKIILNSPGLDIEIQTKQVNEAAIRSITKNGFVLSRQDDECYYFKLPETSKKPGR